MEEKILWKKKVCGRKSVVGKKCCARKSSLEEKSCLFTRLSFVLNASEPLAEWVEKTGNFQPNFLSGYPSCLAMLLDLQKEGQIDLHPLKVITGGEPLREDLKTEFEECFGADVIDYYGCCESLMVGAGSSWYRGMYLFDDMNYTEVDDKGHLILTPLYTKKR